MLSYFALIALFFPESPTFARGRKRSFAHWPGNERSWHQCEVRERLLLRRLWGLSGYQSLAPKGRIGRADWWLKYFLVLIVITVVAGVLDSALGFTESEDRIGYRLLLGS